MMADANGPNARPLDETIAGIGGGIPDDALGPGEELPAPPSDAEVAAAARRMGAPIPAAAGRGGADPGGVNPGDDAAPGTPGTGENVCRTCNGSGRLGDGDCPECGGTGIVVEGIGGG